MCSFGGVSYHAAPPIASIKTSFSFTIQELLYFIKHGNLSKVKAIFEQHGKATIDKYWKSENCDYVSPIHEAAESGHNHILKYLLSPSIAFDINELTSHGSHILHLAAYRGHVSTLKFIIDEHQISPEVRTAESQCTPLILAARNGHENVVIALLETYHVEINHKDYTGSTALHRASGWNQPHIIDYLVCDADADMEVKRDDDGFTSLMLAVYYNKWDSVDLLLDLGANIEEVSLEGCTPAHIAMERNNFKSLYYLIQRGADIDRVCKGCTVRHMADFGTLELKRCVNDALNEYGTYYENVWKEFESHLKRSHYGCADVVECVMDFAFPKRRRPETKKHETGSKRKSEACTEPDDFAPPQKKQRLHCMTK